MTSDNYIYLYYYRDRTEQYFWLWQNRFSSRYNAVVVKRSVNSWWISKLTATRKQACWGWNASKGWNP